MPVEWKKSGRFKPGPILNRIDTARSVDSEGKASFSGFVANECLPTLLSMLTFPPAADGLEKEKLLWRSLARVRGRLTPDGFLEALRAVLRERLSVREQDYLILTNLSLSLEGLPKKLRILECLVELRAVNFPIRYRAARDKVISQHHVSVPLTPASYCCVVVRTKARSEGAAFHKAMLSVDLLRGVLCTMANSRIQITYGGPSLDPINAIRPGSRHTAHLASGEIAGDGLWFEPAFAATRVHRFDKPDVVTKNLQFALKRIHESALRDTIVSSLTRYVRALDQDDFSSAYLRLWSALEALTISEASTDYSKLIRRVAFLFPDHGYHTQVLEHLREYRNLNVHQGEEGEYSRIHCFQLQSYYVRMAWFYIRNAKRFRSVSEAIEFLDLPPDPLELRRLSVLMDRAARFRAPA